MDNEPRETFAQGDTIHAGHLAAVRRMKDEIARLTAERDEAQAECERKDAALSAAWAVIARAALAPKEPK